MPLRWKAPEKPDPIDMELISVQSFRKFSMSSGLFMAKSRAVFAAEVFIFDLHSEIAPDIH